MITSVHTCFFKKILYDQCYLVNLCNLNFAVSDENFVKCHLSDF